MIRPADRNSPTVAELAVLRLAHAGNGSVDVTNAPIYAVRALEAAELGVLIDSVFWISPSGEAVVHLHGRA